MSDGSSDINLLLGILAIQKNFISSDDLIKGITAWTANKDRSLGQILEDLGLLSATDHDQLGRFVADKIAQAQRGTGENIIATLGHTPSTGNLTELTNDPPSLWEANSQAVLGAPDAEGDVYHPSSDPRAMRFQKIRFHDKGGLGEIHIAVDREVPREVALKELKPRYANVPASRERFAQEARITGALEHPGVVPVYGLGQYSNGQLYYSMRFIEGETLSKEISRYHKADRKQLDPGEHRLEFRKLLDHFIDICQVIDYAHSRGVIHRDIKPDNIMLGPYGETLLVDWGLAKKIDEEDIGIEQATNQPSPVKIRHASTTLPGSVVGTPAYMSPEQALGSVDQVGPASDIYSLGATFYRILTGRFPFQGETALEQVVQGKFKHPCEVVSGVPRALEAICVKAMACDPENRYHSAGALATDIERWLADEPVSVYREPFLQRSMRFARHHKVAVSTSAALLLTAVVAAMIWLQVESVRDRDALSDAQKNLGAGQEALASEDFPKALKFFAEAEAIAKKRTALENIYTDAAGQRQGVEQTIETRRQFVAMLSQVDASMDEIRFRSIHGELPAGRDLCRSIYDQYHQGAWGERLESEDLDSESINRLRQNMAEAMILLARTEVILAPGDKRPEALRKAIALLDEAENLRRGQRAVYRLRSDYYRQLGEPSLADADGERMHQIEPVTAFDYFLEGTDARSNGDILGAITQYENALAEKPDDLWSLMMLAVCYLERKDPVRANAAYDQAIRLRPQFAWAYVGKALALADIGNWEDAHAALNRAESISPNFYGVSNNRGAVNLTQAMTAADGVGTGQKMRWLSRAVEQFENSYRLEPSNLGALSNLGTAYVERAAILQDRGADVEAQSEIDRAIVSFSQALQQFPDYLPALLGRGKARLWFGEKEAALQDLLYAQRIAPRDPRVEYQLGRVYEKKAEQADLAGKIALADENFRQAERGFDRALRLRPQWPEALFSRGRVRHRLWQLSLRHAAVDLDAGIIKQAMADFDAAAESAVALGRDAMADLYKRRADLKAGSGREDEALVDYQLALQSGYVDANIPLRLGWVRLTDTASVHEQFDRMLQDIDRLSVREQAEALNGRGYARALLGEDTAAVADADAAIKLLGDNWQVLYNGASIYGVTTGIAQQELQNEKLAEQRAQRTIALLRKAIAHGLPDKRVIREDRAFVSLRNKPEFKAIFE
jgi:serine/threonine protein kinase/cytochrome c-type biogenesis protein CcmH/NrfG